MSKPKRSAFHPIAAATIIADAHGIPIANELSPVETIQLFTDIGDALGERVQSVHKSLQTKEARVTVRAS